MRADVMLEMENANDNWRKFHEDQYRNVPLPLSREKGREGVTIEVLNAIEFSIAISVTHWQQREGYGCTIAIVGAQQIEKG